MDIIAYVTYAYVIYVYDKNYSEKEKREEWSWIVHIRYVCYELNK